MYHEKKIEAVLEVEGVGAGYGWGTDEKLGRLFIIDKSKITGRWISYIQSEADEKLVQLRYVPVIFLSEMLAAIEEGRKSAREEGSIPIEEVIKEISEWSTKSP